MDVKIDGIDKVMMNFKGFENQIPFAVSKALNDTVYLARIDVQSSLQSSFDRPTPKVQKGVLYEKSTKENLSAAVYIKGDDTKEYDTGMNVARVLEPHIFGGERGIKASESMLRRAGLMRSSQWIVPGPGAPLDAYGNISASNMTKILSAVQANTAAGYDANASSRSRRRNKRNWAGALYCIPFVGIFVNTGGRRSMPVLFFTDKAPQYKTRFDFFGTATASIQKNILQKLTEAMAYAVRTAK